MGMVGVWLDLAEGLFVGLWRVGDRDSSPSYLIPLPKGGLEERIDQMAEQACGPEGKGSW